MLKAYSGSSGHQTQPACHPQPDTHAFLCVHSVLSDLFLTDLCRDRELRATKLSSLAPPTLQGDRANLYTIDICERHGAPVRGTVKNWILGTASLRNEDPFASLYPDCFEGVYVELTFASVRVTQCMPSHVPAWT